MRRAFSALCVGLIYSTNVLAAVPTDFDGDGFSDFTRVEVNSGGKLVWKAVLSTTGSSVDITTFGNKGDMPTPARWLGKGTQVGVVVEPAEGQSDLVWSILDENGVRVDKSFGKPGDLIVAGGDFNGNGTADAAVVRLVNGKAVWQIAYDLFTTSSTTQELSFGKQGDRVFFARVEDGGIDWIGAIGKGKRNRSEARMQNLVTSEVRRYSRMPKFAGTGTRPRPFPIRQSSGADLLGFQVVTNSTTEIRVYDLTGMQIATSSLMGTGTVAVGDFSSGEGYEVAFQGTVDNLIINPVQGEEREAQNVGGVPVDEIAVGVVGDIPAGSSSTGGGSTPSGEGSLSQCSSVMGWPSGHVYKTIGSNHFSDIRRNTIGIVVKSGGRGPFPSCVQAIDTSGKIIAQLGLYQKGAGWAARYYAGIGCGAGTPLNGASVASKARAGTGSSKIYMNFGGVCYGPIEASECIGSQQC